MKTKEIYVGNYEDVWLDIYVVGYPEEGESILCLIRDSEEIKFTFLTDSYIYDYGKGWYNHIDHLLYGMKVEHIDAFIWTHPDVDHSLDIPRMLDTYDKLHQAQIYLPSLDGILGMKPVAKATNNYLYNRYSGKGSRKYQIKAVDVEEDSEDDDRMILAKGLFCIKLIEKSNITGIPMSCIFNFLSPVREYVDRYKHYQMASNFNELSLSLALSVNGRNLLLCGDIEDRTIKRIDENCLHDVVYVKIPHHASGKSSSLLFERLNRNKTRGAVSTTTTFKANNLPDSVLLGKYKQISNSVYSTGADTRHYFGCIKSSVHLADFSIITDSYGSAIAV